VLCRLTADVLNRALTVAPFEIFVCHASRFD
jgi:hypothetical protein